MKISKSRLIVNQQTFEPMLQLIIEVPIEPAMDSMVRDGGAEYYEALGRQLAEGIHAQTKLLQSQPIPSINIGNEDDHPVSPLAHIGRED